MSNERLLEVITSIKSHIENTDSDCSNVYLYGSQARGEATEDSDIDIMVVDDINLYKTLSSYSIELSKEVGIEVSVQYTTSEIINSSYLAFWYTFRRDCLELTKL